MSFFGFIFVAPGGVYIRNHVTVRKNGIISLAGPATNLVLTVLFVAIALAFPALSSPALYGAVINSWLALFNMLPFPFFDGSKVLVWNKLVYGIVLIISIAFAFGSQAIHF